MALIVFGLLGMIYVQGWITLMVVLLFSSGIIMLTLGILGEYIWRILDVAQNRPVYFIEHDTHEDKDKK
jgi:dolichol-phosphate mannosyltransferase